MESPGASVSGGQGESLAGPRGSQRAAAAQALPQPPFRGYFYSEGGTFAPPAEPTERMSRTSSTERRRHDWANHTCSDHSNGDGAGRSQVNLARAEATEIGDRSGGGGGRGPDPRRFPVQGGSGGGGGGGGEGDEGL
ncbi:alanine and glycine-rich protein-like [Gracilinanus agilis]|uniref:alanine and glycine-rich protein-like n=1 Tax=Gracilinanus agilis TaxID=191870 RepID=UPI001CFDEF58|nr:alanine and glycine-rich protein-like [Gracilinanus agilis]